MMVGGGAGGGGSLDEAEDDENDEEAMERSSAGARLLLRPALATVGAHGMALAVMTTASPAAPFAASAVRWERLASFLAGGAVEGSAAVAAASLQTLRGHPQSTAGAACLCEARRLCC